MGRRIDCPFGGWVELPDEWLGRHARRRDEAREKSKALPTTLQNFAVAIALCENWGELPGLGGNPDKWDFDAVPWPLLSWVSDTVFTDLALALSVPRPISPPSPSGSTETAETTSQPGTLTPEA